MLMLVKIQLFIVCSFGWISKLLVFYTLEFDRILGRQNYVEHFGY